MIGKVENSEISFSIDQFNMGYNQGIKDTKDALLKWAENEARKCLKVDGELDLAIGRHAAFMIMIDKIGSL